MQLKRFCRAARWLHGPVEADGAEAWAAHALATITAAACEHPSGRARTGRPVWLPGAVQAELWLCEVMLCESLLGAVRHASLASLSFFYAHPAPRCRAVVVQLGQGLRRVNRGSVLTVRNSFNWESRWSERSLVGVPRRAPIYKFKAALEAAGL